MEKPKSAKKVDGIRGAVSMGGVSAGLCKEGAGCQVPHFLPPQLRCQARSEHPSLGVMSKKDLSPSLEAQCGDTGTVKRQPLPSGGWGENTRKGTRRAHSNRTTNDK